MKIYVASSWRNEYQPDVVQALCQADHEVFDFRHPVKDDVFIFMQSENDGFHWSEIDQNWKSWTPQEFRKALRHPLAVQGFNKDMLALQRCDAVVLVLPCGRSSHLELGWAVAADKLTCVLLSDGEPELMYSMVDKLCIDLEEVLFFLED